jgi:hypothetical protein
MERMGDGKRRRKREDEANEFGRLENHATPIAAVAD